MKAQKSNIILAVWHVNDISSNLPRNFVLLTTVHSMGELTSNIRYDWECEEKLDRKAYRGMVQWIVPSSAGFNLTSTSLKRGPRLPTSAYCIVWPGELKTNSRSIFDMFSYFTIQGMFPFSKSWFSRGTLTKTSITISNNMENGKLNRTIKPCLKSKCSKINGTNVLWYYPMLSSRADLCLADFAREWSQVHAEAHVDTFRDECSHVQWQASACHLSFQHRTCIWINKRGIRILSKAYGNDSNNQRMNERACETSLYVNHCFSWTQLAGRDR